MKTLRLAIDPGDLACEASEHAIEAAASILRDGGLVAFPTETVYGLGANALNADAVARIFEAKQRPAWDPVIAHIDDSAMLFKVLAPQPIPSCAQRLMSAFWPGPLTLLLPKAESIPAIVTAGRPLVGVRMPANPVAQALIAAAGFPIAAPSANTFGRISPTTAAHVLEDLDGRIDAILDGGETTHGVESTVVDAAAQPVILYRPGVVTLQDIQRICGSALTWDAAASTDAADASPESLPSPGVGIRHYAPRARLILVGGDLADQPQAIANAVRQANREKLRIGVMLPRAFLTALELELVSQAVIFDWGDWSDLPELAHRLFAGLRQLDSAGIDSIVCPLPPPTGVGAAIQDRLLKAAKLK